LSSLSPLYWGGLWEAVIIIPASNSRVTKASVGVGSTPASLHRAPAASSPPVTACLKVLPEVRVSRPIITLEYRVPMARPTCKASWTKSRSTRRLIPEVPNNCIFKDCSSINLKVNLILLPKLGLKLPLLFYYYT
jgi:hypothetical protein